MKAWPITEPGRVAKGLRRFRGCAMWILYAGIHDDRQVAGGQNPDPTEDEIREALSSNLCRCTGYLQMYQAIRAVIHAEQKGMKEELVGAK